MPYFFQILILQTVLIPVLLGLPKYRFLSTSLRIILYWMIAASLTELVAAIVQKSGSHNLFVYNIYTLAEFNLVALFFYFCIKNRSLLNAMLPICIAFNIIILIDGFYIEGWQNINSISIGIEMIILMALTIIYFFEMVNDTSSIYLEKLPLFWIIVGLLLYISGTFFIYIFQNYLTKNHPQMVLDFGVLNHFILIVRNILFCVAYLKVKRY